MSSSGWRKVISRGFPWSCSRQWAGTVLWWLLPGFWGSAPIVFALRHVCHPACVWADLTPPAGAPWVNPKWDFEAAFHLLQRKHMAFVSFGFLSPSALLWFLFRLKSLEMLCPTSSLTRGLCRDTRAGFGGCLLWLYFMAAP